MKQEDIEKNRSEFDWVTEINCEKTAPHFLYPFCENGVTLLVSKYDYHTDGMGCYIIDEFINDKNFKRTKKEEFVKRFGSYFSNIKTTKKDTDLLYEKIKSIKMSA